METSSKGRARTSQLVGRCRVEEQTVAVVRDYELTRNGDAHNASNGLVKVEHSEHETAGKTRMSCMDVDDPPERRTH